MPLSALALVIAGALLHALWNLLAKKAAGGLPFVWLYGLVSLVFAAPFGLHAWLKASEVLSVSAWAAIAASAALHVAYSLILQQGYRVSDFSLVYPLARGSGPLFAVLGAILTLGEAPTLIGSLGIAAILLGIFLVSGITELTRSRPRQLLAGVFWGMLTGLFIAAYTLVDGWAIKSLGLAPVLYYVLGLGIRSALLTPQALRQIPALGEQWRRNRPYILGVGLLSPLAYTLVLFALTQAPLSYVAPVREASMLIGVLLGARLLREALSPARLLGMACMLAGVIVLAQ